MTGILVVDVIRAPGTVEAVDENDPEESTVEYDFGGAGSVDADASLAEDAAVAGCWWGGSVWVCTDVTVVPVAAGTLDSADGCDDEGSRFTRGRFTGSVCTEVLGCSDGGSADATVVRAAVAPGWLFGRRSCFVVGERGCDI